MTDTLVLIAKEPRPGLSKTRLAADIGANVASRLALALLEDTLDLARDCGADRVTIAFAPSDARAWFEERAPWATLTPQPDGTLGDRMLDATRRAFEDGAERAVLIGMDTPQLPEDRLRRAFESLRTHDVCVGPAHDGGYYLLGLRRVVPALFEAIPWSSDGVLDATLEVCRAMDLSVHRLEIERDVDHLSDLRALLRTLRDRPSVAPRTRKEMTNVVRAGLLDRRPSEGNDADTGTT